MCRVRWSVTWNLSQACQYGYDDYFEEMINAELVFIHENYTSYKVYCFIVENVCLPENKRYLNPPSFRAGFVFGWLSALSKYQPMMAKVGVQVLCSVEHDLEHDKHNTTSVSVVAHE